MSTKAKTKTSAGGKESERFTLPADPARREQVLALLREAEAAETMSAGQSGEAPEYVVESTNGMGIMQGEAVRLINRFGQERQASAVKRLSDDGAWLVCYAENWYLATQSEAQTWRENGREAAIKLGLVSEPEPEGEAAKGEESP